MVLNKPKILIVEDEPEIARVLRAILEKNEYAPLFTREGQEGLRLCAAQPPDLIILDLGLPDSDGKDFISSLRTWSATPILVLSARGEETEKAEALNRGADDYVTKPFSTLELLARIKAALRRSARRERPPDQVYRHHNLCVDMGRRQVTLHGQDVHLTPKEYDLLTQLVKKAGQVVTQTELLRTVWGKNASENDNDHYLRIYIRHLRQKLRDDPLAPVYIFTEPGIGYRLSEDELVS